MKKIKEKDKTKKLYVDIVNRLKYINDDVRLIKKLLRKHEETIGVSVKYRDKEKERILKMHVKPMSVMIDGENWLTARYILDYINGCYDKPVDLTLKDIRELLFEREDVIVDRNQGRPHFNAKMIGRVKKFGNTKKK